MKNALLIKWTATTLVGLSVLTAMMTFNRGAEANDTTVTKVGQPIAKPTTPLSRTALLITDPQNDFLSADGAAHALVKDNLTEHDVIDHMEQLLRAAKANSIPVFVSPHMYFPHDRQWRHRGPLQRDIRDLRVFAVEDTYYRKDLPGSGADFLERYKPYLLDGQTVITSPHKVFGPDSNDLVLQLRKRGIERVVVAGLAANLCTDSHMRELIEQGFEVVMIKDAVGAPGPDAYNAALLNYSLIANEVWTTEQTLSNWRQQSAK